MNTTPERLLKLPSVRDLTTLSTTSIYKQMDDGTFPRPIKIGTRAVAWRHSDIQKWIEDRITEAGLD